jgi:hypothetical protein
MSSPTTFECRIDQYGIERMYEREFILHRNINQTDIWRFRELGILIGLDDHGGLHCAHRQRQFNKG